MPLAAWGGTEDAARKRRRCAALALSPISASRSKPARILGLKENAAADGIRRFAARCMSARCGWSVGAGPRRWWSAARRCALRDHGPRKAMRSATTTMLRLAALHLPSPFLRRERGPPRARVKREGLCDTHALSRSERIPRGCLTTESELKCAGSPPSRGRRVTPAINCRSGCQAAG